MKFKSNNASRIKIDPEDIEVIGDRLEAIAEDGELTATSVLAEAEREDSPLHKYFEWDDTEAARQYRLTQARGLVRSLMITFIKNQKTETTRAFHLVKYSRDDSQEPKKQYVPAMKIFSDRELSDQIIRTAEAAMRSWLTRFEQYSELSAASEHIRRALSALPKAERGMRE